MNKEFKIPSIKEIIEQVREQSCDRQLASQKAHEDEFYEFDLRFAHSRKKAWKKWYFKKNSAKNATIRVIADSILLGGTWHYRHYLQLFRGGKLLEQCLIKEEAFDVLTRNITSEITGSLEIFILEKFESQKLNNAKS